MLRVSYIKGNETSKPARRPRKPSKKQLQEQRVRAWVFKQRMREHDRLCKKYAARISKLQQIDPNWEIPKPTF